MARLLTVSSCKHGFPHPPSHSRWRTKTVGFYQTIEGWNYAGNNKSCVFGSVVWHSARRSEITCSTVINSEHNDATVN